MIDSYILHIISKVDYARSMEKFDREIKTYKEENEVMRQRSLYYAANNNLLFIILFVKNNPLWFEFLLKIYIKYFNI